LFDPEPFQIGGDLTAVVGGVIDNVAQHRPRTPQVSLLDEFLQLLRPQFAVVDHQVRSRLPRLQDGR
jgi:hypothetical protein